MPHSYVKSLHHVVFSTKRRARLIDEDLKERLHAYLGGISRENRTVPIAVGGVEDHMHLLIALASTLSIAKVMQVIKASSSKWVHETFPNRQEFEWQVGYGSFSIGASQIDRTVAYIQKQAEHHKKETFQDEFIRFLKIHGVEYDERYIWD